MVRYTRNDRSCLCWFNHVLSRLLCLAYWAAPLVACGWRCLEYATFFCLSSHGSSFGAFLLSFWPRANWRKQHNQSIHPSKTLGPTAYNMASRFLYTHIYTMHDAHLKALLSPTTVMISRVGTCWHGYLYAPPAKEALYLSVLVCGGGCIVSNLGAAYKGAEVCFLRSMPSPSTRVARLEKAELHVESKPLRNSSCL